MTKLSRVTVDLAKKHPGRAPSEIEERRVVEHIEERRPISQDVGDVAEREETAWVRLADNVARIGGSWPFIGAFFLFLFAWTAVNGFALSVNAAFDP
ncbi:hypothetical protein [Aurantiacibacter atlanticus]|nr:hypothetical protein [Aurantiacibacter atlanticus]